MHSTWVSSEMYSAPSIVLQSRQRSHVLSTPCLDLLTDLSRLCGAEMDRSMCSMTSVRPIRGCGTTRMRTARLLVGGIMATRQRQWPIGPSWWTTTRGTTHTSPPLVVPWPLPKERPGRSIDHWTSIMSSSCSAVTLAIHPTTSTSFYGWCALAAGSFQKSVNPIT